MAKHGHGTTFSWNGNTVGKLTNIGTPQITADSIDVTTHQSADSFREFIPGLLNAGAVTLSGWFKASDTDGQAAMLADMASRTVREAIVTLPDNLATFTFNGFLTSWNLGEAGSDGAIPFAAEVKVTGKPTFAVATVTGMSACVVSGAGTTISPTFAIGTKSYVVNVANEEDSVTFTCTSGETITLTYDSASQTLASAVASSEIPLTAGEVKEVKVTISAANKAPKVYTFHVVRAA